jgi:hypothetical protein
LTMSEQTAEPSPVKMFLHLIGPDGEIAAQWDGLGIAWQSWMMGDGLVQQHVLPLPDGLARGTYRLWAGFYAPDSLTRWAALDENGERVDRILLEELTVP